MITKITLTKLVEKAELENIPRTRIQSNNGYETRRRRRRCRHRPHRRTASRTINFAIKQALKVYVYYN